MDKTLALKALNQYRKRDVIAYLGLRYYLDNRAAQSPRWIGEVATKVAADKTQPCYLKTFHYKDRRDNGAYLHRDMHLPSPNEALAEVALITELSKYDAFHPQPFVYSYRLAKPNEKSGVFKPYFNGFRERQKDIAKACKKKLGSVVLYTDIKKFYPSIRVDDATKAWREKTANSGLQEEFIQLGFNLLSKQAEVSQRDDTGQGLLTGPVFSHVIANLLLDDLDSFMHELTGGHYWRYVDDIVLVGTENEVSEWRAELEEHLDDLALELHDGDKDFDVPSKIWLEGEKDFESAIGFNWISLIADTKRFLISHPSDEAYQNLQQRFLENNVRIPVLDYSLATKEVDTLQKFSNWLKKYKGGGWSYKIVRSIDIDYLISLAKSTKFELLENLEKLLENTASMDQYARKRLIPKLRFTAGRLIFLATEQELKTLAARLGEYPELRLLTQIMKCVASRNISEILKMGTNATQAACQVLRSMPGPVKVTLDEHDEVTELSMAIMAFNGVEFERGDELSELGALAHGEGLRELMRSDDKFIQEIACLHGDMPPRHHKILTTAFDIDEDLALDVVNQLQNSSHC